MRTWREDLTRELEHHGETWGDVVHSVGDLDREFDHGYGGPDGPPFTLWTKHRVYFPLCYDGAESVGSCPRNPCAHACEHQGGW